LSDLYKALVVDREIQCLATSLASHELILQAAGYSAADFAPPFIIQPDELYYAFNIETDDELINRFQDQLEIAKTYNSEDGSSVYEKILNRYSMILDAEDGITDEMAINLVNRTVTDIESDAAGTFAKINQGLAPYVDQQNPALYIFVYDTNVVMMAHGTNPGMVGKSYAGKPDAAGKCFRDEIVRGALANGSGWVDYIYTKPDESGLYRKTSYYQLAVGSDKAKYIVCAGKYK
jgi:polar amino acid transport system substrate-binding protein